MKANFHHSGFLWPNGELNILFTDDEFGIVFEINTKRERVQIRVTPSGLIRIDNKQKQKGGFLRGKEAAEFYELVTQEK